MKVVKIGGGCLNGKKTIEHILTLIQQRCRGQIVVVSALKGVTDFLIECMPRALEANRHFLWRTERSRLYHQCSAARVNRVASRWHPDPDRQLQPDAGHAGHQFRHRATATRHPDYAKRQPDPGDL